MTALLRGLTSLNRNAGLGTRNCLSFLHSHGCIGARCFTIQLCRHAEGSGLPAFKVDFPPLPLDDNLRTRTLTEKSFNLTRVLETNPALPENFKALPAIPPRPERGLTPWLTNDEARQYLPLLYSRQWSVARYRPPEAKKKVIYQVLSKVFFFKGEKAAADFSLDTTSIVNKMAHHPTIFKVKGTMVVFRILTHDAYVNSTKSRPIVTPGITMHDVRVAMRIEKKWEQYWAESKARLPQQGWKFTGRRTIAIRYWGILEARMRPDWREEAGRSQVRLRNKWLKTQGKGLRVKGKRRKKRKKETPRWKKMKWKNQARRRNRAQSSVETQPTP